MSYNHTCQDRFTECQSARMKFALENYRQGLWSESNLTCVGAGGFWGNDIVINSNENWTTTNLPNGGNITVSGTLTIQPNPNTPNDPVTLNIGPGVTVHFCGEGKVVIKPNANLDLSGTLTNSCKGQWQGVEVWGDNTKSQYVQSGKRWQGRLIGRTGGVIENAKVGARLWGPDYANAGGQISCEGTTFRDNYRAVEFAPYENFWPFSNPSGWLNDVRNYLGSFTECAFITDDEYPGTQQFNAFLHMTGVRGVSISGSSFTNNRAITSNSFIAWGYGIFATDAGFNVTAKGVGNTYPPSSYIASGFNNLGYGIYTANTTGNKPYSVQQSNFNGCFVGLYNKGVSAGVTLFNTFNLGKVPSTAIIPITPLGSPTKQDQVGAMFENAISGFTFEENDFLKVSGNVTNTIGTICKNTGSFNNVVRKNRYTGISHGNVANDNNGIFVTPARGLYYLCNENTDVSTHDFLVANGMIRTRQGIEVAIITPGQQTTYTYNAAGNRFSYFPGITLSDFKNAVFVLDYYYNPNKPNQEPLDVSSGVNKIVAAGNDCLISYCKPPCKSETELEQIKGQYYIDRGIWQGLKAEYAIAPTPQKAQGIALHQSRMDAAAYMIVLHELHDTIGFSLDTLRTWIGNMNSLESELWLASDYVRTGEANKATLLLNAASTKYQLDSDAQGTVNSFKSVLDLISGKQVYALNETTRNDLATYAASQGYAAGLAQNILTWYGAHYPPAYTIYTTGERSDNLKSGTSVQGRSVIVFPNPSSGTVVLRFALPTTIQNTSLRVMDVNGRLVQIFDLLPANGETNMTFTAPGMYFYQLVADGCLIESGKIVIQR